MADHKKPQIGGPGGGTEVIAGDASDGWEAVPTGLPIELPTGEHRYRIERELARGSMGVVRVARDLSLQRRVALKELRPETSIPNAAARFLDEARITAQLQHPGIVAVYEIGVDAEARPFFTMQLIEGRTLRQILEGLVESRPDMVRRFSRVRLLNIFMQVCMAVAYAHNRGVIHRDLKPENIMLGEFGEVFVMDWGLAKIVSADSADPIVGGRPDEAVYRTRVGDITGTPTYMSPEQAMGLVDALSSRTDIYALGALLYELLTLKPPFCGATTTEILQKVRQSALVKPTEAAPDADIPVELEWVVLRAMARDPVDRFTSATELRDEVEACLHGTRTQIHRVRTAAKALRDAARAGQAFREQARRRRRFAREVRESAALLLPFDPPSVFDEVWAAQHRLEALDEEVDATFEGAVALYQQVLRDAAENVEAHEGLRDLFWYRFLEAERQDDGQAMRLYKSLASQHDPRGTLHVAMTGDGSLAVNTVPAGARLTLSRVGRTDRVLRPADPRPCGAAPALLDPLPMGSYVLELHADGREPTRLPVVISRQETAETTVRLLPAGALPPDCVHVPAGPYWSGAHEPDLSAPPRTRLVIDDFVIARTPVTVEAYAAFLADLVERGDPQRARRHLPRGAHPWREGLDGRLHPEEHGGNPVTGITERDARAYCAWLTEGDGLPWRLPTAVEWEKAARGVDGRRYPWGDAWDPTRCRCADGPEGGAPSAVGNELDESPYGVRDLAGGVREWTATEHPRDARQRALKGGGFDSPRALCHLAVVRYRKLDRPAPDVGFRLALDFAALWR